MRRVLLQSGRYCLFEGFSFCATGGSFSKFISEEESAAAAAAAGGVGLGATTGTC